MAFFLEHCLSLVAVTVQTTKDGALLALLAMIKLRDCVGRADLHWLEERRPQFHGISGTYTSRHLSLSLRRV